MASINTHFLVTSAGFCEKVFITCHFQLDPGRFSRPKGFSCCLDWRAKPRQKQTAAGRATVQARLIGEGRECVKRVERDAAAKK
ncbi:MAG: hypothetical protein KDA32_15875, partial [Phycisphaerales bacterium]|nr:hypothetical protein [Phycisphaerales bacterium]